MALHRGINFSSMEVEGNLGGFVFAAGTVICTLIGLPWLVPAFLASLTLGVGLAFVLHAWHARYPAKSGQALCLRTRHPSEPGPAPCPDA